MLGRFTQSKSRGTNTERSIMPKVWLISLFFAVHCAGSGLSPVSPSSTPQEPPQSSDVKSGAVSTSDETVAINFTCSCKDLVDQSIRAPFSSVSDSSARLQSSCTYLKPNSANDYYLVTVVYSGKTQKDFDAAVARARKGYESVGDLKTESMEGGVVASYFTASGTKSRVLASLAFDSAKQLIVEAREVHLDTVDIALPEHAPATATSALSQASWVCKKP